MPRNVVRMAKSDGIIAKSRAVPLRKTKRKTTKMSAAVSAKLCASVGTRLVPTFSCSNCSPTTLSRADASGPGRVSSNARWMAAVSAA